MDVQGNKKSLSKDTLEDNCRTQELQIEKSKRNRCVDDNELNVEGILEAPGNDCNLEMFIPKGQNGHLRGFKSKPEKKTKDSFKNKGGPKDIGSSFFILKPVPDLSQLKIPLKDDQAVLYDDNLNKNSQWKTKQNSKDLSQEKNSKERTLTGTNDSNETKPVLTESNLNNKVYRKTGKPTHEQCSDRNAEAENWNITANSNETKPNKQNNRKTRKYTNDQCSYRNAEAENWNQREGGQYGSNISTDMYLEKNAVRNSNLAQKKSVLNGIFRVPLFRVIAIYLFFRINVAEAVDLHIETISSVVHYGETVRLKCIITGVEKCRQLSWLVGKEIEDWKTIAKNNVSFIDDYIADYEKGKYEYYTLEIKQLQREHMKNWYRCECGFNKTAIQLSSILTVETNTILELNLRDQYIDVYIHISDVNSSVSVCNVSLQANVGNNTTVYTKEILVNSTYNFTVELKVCKVEGSVTCFISPFETGHGKDFVDGECKLTEDWYTVIIAIGVTIPVVGIVIGLVYCIMKRLKCRLSSTLKTCQGSLPYISKETSRPGVAQTVVPIGMEIVCYRNNEERETRLKMLTD